MKHCPYCGRGHNRRSRACSQWCERRLVGKLAYVTRSRRAACRALVEEAQRVHRHDRTFRAAALGTMTIEDVALKVFGIETVPALFDPSEGYP